MGIVSAGLEGEVSWGNLNKRSILIRKGHSRYSSDMYWKDPIFPESHSRGMSRRGTPRPAPNPGVVVSREKVTRVHVGMRGTVPEGESTPVKQIVKILEKAGLKSDSF